MNGIIVVNKEKGMTSHDVVNKIRRIFNTKRVGHLGTLDPLATGVLVVCINDATKLVQFLQEHDKSYLARVCIGKSTDTYDLEGNIVDQIMVNEVDSKHLDFVINSFLKETKQLPPMYSSVKVNGKKLYEYARNGEKVELSFRDIKIHEIKRVSDLIYCDDLCYFDLYLNVSKGTYVRSVCYDIGCKLGLPSMMVDLKRLSSDVFKIEDASTLDQIACGDYKMYSMLDALRNFHQISQESIVYKAKNGIEISKEQVRNILSDNPSRIVIKESNNLIAIYELSQEKSCYKAVRVWN